MCRHTHVGSWRWQAVIAAFFLFAAGNLLVVAADPDNPFATEQEKIAAAKPRTWTDSKSKFSVEAKLVKVEDGKAVLKRNDDKEIKVPLEMLSDADRKYVATFSGTSLANSGISAAKTFSAAGANSTTPKLQLNTTDYHRANALDLGNINDWSYKPDVASPQSKLQAARVPLQAFDSNARPRSILIAPQEKKAYVVFYNSHTSRVQACNLQTNEMEAEAVFAENEFPIAISPNGTFVLSQIELTAENRKSELHLYTRDGRQVKLLKGWRPYEVTGPGAREDADTEVKWARFADAEHIFTLSAFGKLVLWQIAPLKPVWGTNLAASLAEPAFSAGHKYVALVLQRNLPMVLPSAEQPAGERKPEANVAALISIVSVTSGKAVASIPLDADPGMCAVALRDDGARLALSQSGRIRVWDLQTRTLVRDFALQQVGPTATIHKLEWTGDNYLLVGGDMIIDVERRVLVGQFYHGYIAYTCCDGKVWHVDEEAGPKARVLTSVMLPNQAIQEATAKLRPEDLLVLHPGLEVAIDCQISGDAAAKSALEEQLKKNGMKVVPQSKVHLVATLQAGKPVIKRYHAPRTPLRVGHEYEVATQVFSLSFEIDGKSVWKYIASTSPPDFLQLKEGQTIEQALHETMQKQEDSLPKRCATIWIPAYLARAPGDEGNNNAPAAPAQKRSIAQPET